MCSRKHAKSALRKVLGKLRGMHANAKLAQHLSMPKDSTLQEMQG